MSKGNAYGHDIIASLQSVGIIRRDAIHTTLQTEIIQRIPSSY